MHTRGRAISPGEAPHPDASSQTDSPTHTDLTRSAATSQWEEGLVGNTWQYHTTPARRTPTRALTRDIAGSYSGFFPCGFFCDPSPSSHHNLPDIRDGATVVTQATLWPAATLPAQRGL